MSRVVVIGEGMLELSVNEGTTQFSYGGDTLNTAVYLSRLGVRANYMSALGVDPLSNNMIEALESEGLGTEFILRHPTQLPGLYAIRTGERDFYYWRENSAVRCFFDLPKHLAALDFAAGANWLYLSGITLSIFDKSDRQKLGELAAKVKTKGGQIAFDTNYRPKGWQSASAAREAIASIAAQVTLALPTLEDEDMLFGKAAAADHARRWHDWGVKSVIMKSGPAGATVFQQGKPPRHVPVNTPLKPVDTTGAGDSFNAGFMAARMSGRSFTDAAQAGSFLAGHVIQHPGAIIPASAMPKGILKLETTP